MYTDWQEHVFFQRQREWEQAGRFGERKKRIRNRVTFGRRVEVLAAEVLQQRGHQVATTKHKTPWDIWCGGCRVEVKGSKWHGRYQWDTRNEADVFLLATVDAGGNVSAWFVIDAGAIGSRRNITVWASDPLRHHGRWAEYRDAWHLVDLAVQRAGPYPQQLALFF